MVVSPLIVACSSTFDYAVIKDSSGVAKDEIHVAFNEAVVEILPGRRAGCAGAAFAIGKERVLPPDQRTLRNTALSALTKSATACAPVVVSWYVQGSKGVLDRQVLPPKSIPGANTVAEPLVPSVPPLPFDVPAELSKCNYHSRR